MLLIVLVILFAGLTDRLNCRLKPSLQEPNTAIKQFFEDHRIAAGETSYVCRDGLAVDAYLGDVEEAQAIRGEPHLYPEHPDRCGHTFAGAHCNGS